MSVVRQLRGASGLTYGILVGLVAVVAIAAIQRIGGSTNDLFGTVSGAIARTRAAVPAATPLGAIDRTSCRTILQSGHSTGDGVYSIDPDGPGGNAAFNALCDMTTDGGGFTRVLYMHRTNEVLTANLWASGVGGPDFTSTSVTNGIAMSRLATSGTGVELELLAKLNNSNRRIYRGVPLSLVFDGGSSTSIGSYTVQHKLVGGSFVSVTESFQKGGWYYGFYNGSVGAATYGYTNCGWLIGNGAVYGFATSSNCTNDGLNNDTTSTLSIWLR